MADKPQITSPPALFQLEVLKYIASKECSTPSVILLLKEIEGVAFCLGYSCLVAHDHSKEIIGYYYIHPADREFYKKALTPVQVDGQQTLNVESYVEMMGKAIRLIGEQSTKYHTACAKLPPAIADDAAEIEKMKEKFGAKRVFRGPRMEDGRVRMIFQVSGTKTVEELTKDIQQRNDE